MPQCDATYKYFKKRIKKTLQLQVVGYLKKKMQ
jgi:hypothetical protein